MTAIETALLRLRAHSGFRIADNVQRPLILIGNGTGLAGLRAHLQASARTHELVLSTSSDCSCRFVDWRIGSEGPSVLRLFDV